MTMMDKVTFRRASADDARFIAETVASAFGADAVRALGGERAMEALEAAARLDVSQYSYRNTIVCEVDGARAGAVCGYDGGRLYELRQPVIELLHEHCGSVPQLAEETAAGEFYLDSIGVAESMRGRGIGAQLIRRMREEAFAAGYERVGLLVDSVNPDAERLYARLGFVRCGEMDLLGHRMFRMQSTPER